MATDLITDMLGAFDSLVGGTRRGFRPVHARGVMIAGTFVPGPDAVGLTRAPHATRPSTPVTARFSIASGLPTAAENDLGAAGPQGMAVRFHLADHVHTDIIGHSFNGFPARTPEEFLEFIKAALASHAPNAPTPPPIVGFLATHPAARTFVETPKPLPTSYARQHYFAVTAFTFVNAAGVSLYGRFRVVPSEGTAYLSPEQGATKTTDFLDAELSERLAKGAVTFRVQVQLAGPDDSAADSTAVWPEDRPLLDFGTLTLTERVDELAPERRKIIFDPLPRVDGIETAGDPLTAFRADLYLASGRRRRKNAAE